FKSIKEEREFWDSHSAFEVLGEEGWEVVEAGTTEVRSVKNSPSKRSTEKMSNVVTYLETLTRETRKPEAEVMTMAINIGLRQLWRENILGRFLQGKISRDEAIKLVGIDWVELAERQRAAMMEDINWAMGE
ncbi:MAG: hypothetical protein ACREBU_15970, partial [Nitrososphaera sp.]